MGPYDDMRESFLSRVGILVDIAGVNINTL
jgi:hypothetical protein